MCLLIARYSSSLTAVWVAPPVPLAVAPAGVGTSAPFSTPCTAPGTPYSYGPPTTVGTASKLKIGGGDVTCHSSVSARHGLASPRRPPRRALPPERGAAPGVGPRARPAAPGRDHVVGEDERAEAEEEARDRDREVPAGPLLGVVGDAARHPLDADDVHRRERQVEEDERR